MFFILTFLQTLVPYNQLWANNNGPKSPEAASFEPVDATDMVNLLTGDMSYVLPLLNIPSPEGGYPLALSYHAGIAMDQEASWVGLGWNINPGAINRTPNKVPDDWDQIKTYDIVYDKGGFAKNYRGSIDVGISDALSLGVYYNYSENRSFNGETGLNVRNDFGVKGSVGVFSISLGTDKVSTEIGLGSNLIGTEFSISQSFADGTTNATAGIKAQGGTGISLSSQNGLNGSINGIHLGINNQNNGSKSFSTSSRMFGIQIPIYFINVGFSYSRSKYWLFEKDFTINQGSLYSGNMNTALSNSIFEWKVDHDGSESFNTIYRDSELPRGNFSSINYDSYSVSGQGISGVLTPHILEAGYLYNKESILQDGTRKYFTVEKYPNSSGTFTKNIDNVSSKDIHFYFSNEYTSYLNINSGDWNTSLSNPTDIFSYNTINNVFEKSLSGKETYNSNTGRWKKGSYVEVFTNQEIIDNPNKIITPKDFQRISDLVPKKGIGAYKITALDGKTYHYSIPVYQREKIHRVTSIKTDIDTGFSENQQLDPYATHWLLTGITGPDYIDLDNDNKFSKADHGYWVEFEYGKWTDGYSWRTPKEGLREFENIKSYTWGLKDIYYLDKIKTRTHTALFVKEDREDNYSTPIDIPELSDDYQWYDDTHFRSRIGGNDGNIYIGGIYDRLRPVTVFNSQQIIKTTHGINFNIQKQKSLRLDKIIIVDNDNTYSNISKSNSTAELAKSLGSLKIKENYKIWNINGALLESGEIFNFQRDVTGENYNNILDSKDISAIAPNISSTAHKIIDFDYDETYPLASGTPNSTAVTKNGKLTLKSVRTIHKNGAQLIPPYKFDYNLPDVRFDKEKMDSWGYHEDYPDAWSLNTIHTPTGGKINIKYESDSFHKEVVETERVFKDHLVFQFKQFPNGKYLEVKNSDIAENPIDFTKYFEVQKTAYIDVLYWRHPPGAGTSHRMGDVAGKYLVTNVSNDLVTFKIPENNTKPDVRRGANCSATNWVYYNLYHKIIDGWFDEIDRNSCGDPVHTSNGTRVRYEFHSNKKLLASNTNGGGIRVKELSYSSDTGEKYSSQYTYNDPITNQISGITSYAPAEYTKNIDFITELPPPTVMYEHVKISKFSTDNKFLGHNEYKFNTIKNINYTNRGFELDDFLSLKLIQNTDVNGINLNVGRETQTTDINFSRHQLVDNTSSIGLLLHNKQYNSHGHLISSLENEYISDVNEKQGIIQETFKKAKLHVQSGERKKYFVNTSSRLRKQSVLKNTKTIAKDIVSTTDYLQYNLFSGQAEQVITKSGNNTEVKTKIIPAYTIQQYNNMGSKVDNPANKNMLTQTAANLTQIKVGTDWKTIGAGITTWNNDWQYRKPDGSTEPAATGTQKIWRKHKTYTWKGDIDADGAYAGYTGDLDGFVWGSTQSNPKWINTSTVNLYDHYSMPLESQDINGNKVATKMGNEDTKVVAVANAGYNEMFYSGAEYTTGNYIGKEILGGSYRKGFGKAHTGKYYLELKSGDQGFKTIMKLNEHRAGRYKISVWVNKDGADNARIYSKGAIKVFNGERVDAGKYTLLQHYEELSTDAETIYITSSAGEIYADDFRIHPVESSMTSYVYNEWDELTHIIGANNLATRYEYDEAGRLKNTYIEVVDSSKDYLIDTAEQNQIKDIFINSTSYSIDCIRDYENRNSVVPFFSVGNELGIDPAVLSAMNDTDLQQKLQEFYQKISYETVLIPIGSSLYAYECLSDIDKKKIDDIYADTINGKGIGGFKLSNTVQYKYKNQ